MIPSTSRTVSVFFYSEDEPKLSVPGEIGDERDHAVVLRARVALPMDPVTTKLYATARSLAI